MKTKPALLGLAALLLVGCQAPAFLLNQETTAPALQPGKASLNVVLKTNGFTFVPSGSVQGSRFIIPPAPTPGTAFYLLEDSLNVLPDVTGDSLSGLTNIPPGTWDLTVTLKDVDGVRILGTATVAGVTLNPGANSVPVTIAATQSGTGRLDVSYSWITPGIDTATFSLAKLTLTNNGDGTFSASETAVTPDPATVDINAGTAQLAMDLPSGSYRVTLQLSTAGTLHPPVTATVEIYDNITSTASVSLAATQLSGPPAPVGTLTLGLTGGVPYVWWTPTASTLTSYKLLRNGFDIDTLSPYNSSAGDSNYLPGQIQDYSVVAVNAFGRSVASPSVIFSSVTSVNLTPSGVLPVAAGSTTNVSASVLPGDASFPGVNWSSSQSPVAGVTVVDPISVSAKALTLGSSLVSATSVEAAAQTSGLTLQVEAGVTTLAGAAGLPGNIDAVGQAATFTSPNALAFGSDGNLYTVDTNGPIRMIEPNGTVTTLGSTTYSSPAAIAVDASLNIYVASGHAIYQATQGSGYTGTIFAGVEFTSGFADAYGVSALFSSPGGLAILGSTLYVADTGNHRIRSVDVSTGLVTTLDGNGTPGHVDGTVGLGINEYNAPMGIAIDPLGNIYIGDTGSWVIRKIDSTTEQVSTLAGLAGIGGSADGDAATATFASPQGLAVEGGWLYVADLANMVRRVRLPSPGRALEVSTIAGVLSADGAEGAGVTLGSDARLGGTVRGITAKDGAVYVADTGHHTIRKLQTSFYESIVWDDPAFSDPAVMEFNFLTNYLYAGDGLTGRIQVGTILLYTTTLGNHGKLLVTGIDPDANGTAGSGVWRLHLAWTTWDAGGTVVSSGTGLRLVTNGYDSPNDYVDLDSGVLVSTSSDGDMYLAGTTDGNRPFTPAANGVTSGVYR